MLVLSRESIGSTQINNPKSSIEIGDDIRVTLVESKANGRARIGIDASPEVGILRSEMKDKPEEQLERARRMLKLLSSSAFSSKVADLPNGTDRDTITLAKKKAELAFADQDLDLTHEINNGGIEKLLPDDTGADKLKELKPITDFVDALASLVRHQSAIDKVGENFDTLYAALAA